MKKTIAILTVLAVILSGCASFEKSAATEKHANGSTATHVMASTCGLYFLPTIPLWTGNDKPVTLQTTTKTVFDNCLPGHKIVDMDTRTTSTWIPFTFVLWFKTSETVATYVK